MKLFEFLFTLALACPVAYASGTEFYWLENGIVKSENGKTKNTEVKLGSLWKLYAYAYLKANKIVVPDFVSTGQNPEEAFCGKAGERVDMEKALAQSCGLYFEPARLKGAYTGWNKFWDKHPGQGWYSRILEEQHSLSLPLKELMMSLERLRLDDEFGPLLSNALTLVTIKGTARVGLPALGSMVMFKTFTVGVKGGYVGGFAGWLQNGPVVWAQGKGKSYEVIKRESSFLEKWITSRALTRDEGCVVVKHFARYPIQKIADDNNETIKRPVVLKGKFNIKFSNGNNLSIDTNGEQYWDGKIITGRYSIDNYIARVIEREFSVSHVSAAEAMSVVARTYLFQNAKKQSDHCLLIDDSSRLQRVGVNTPSDIAKKIAIKTSSLVLQNTDNIRYQTKTWDNAKILAENDESWVSIIEKLYAKAQIATKDTVSNLPCVIVPRATDWMRGNKTKIDRFLREQLYTNSFFNIKICQTPYLQPFGLIKSKKIYINKFVDIEDQISLVHEYVHFYLTTTHRAHDEKYIDLLAKKALKSIGAL